MSDQETVNHVPELADRAAALALLVDCGSHAFLWPETGREIARMFGLDLAPEQQRNSPDEFKGLSVPDVPAGALVEGYSAVFLAESIARSLDPGFSSPFTGRGFRFQAAVEEIAVYIATTPRDGGAT